MISHSTIKKILLCLSLATAALLPETAFCGAILNVPSNEVPTISEALIKARPGDTVLVDDGRYLERIFIKAGVIVKSRNLHGAIIDGKGRGTVVQLGPNSTIIGFQVTNGTIGVFCKSSGASVIKCKVVKNWLTGVMTVRHLPQIEDNIIAFNKSSGFQGWDIRTTITSMNHNTIAFNGNHGIACGGSSNLIIENNVVAHNERYGLKLSSQTEKSSRIVNNNFYNNLPQVSKIPEGNYNFDPAFISPRTDLNFESDPKLCCQIKSSDNENLGARLLQ